MSVATAGGYVWTLGKYARLLHDGNKFDIKTVTASDDSGTTADLVNNELTRDRWVPFLNQMLDETALNAAAWTPTNVTVSDDGQTVAETTANGQHDLSQAFTFTAEEWVVAFKVERQTVPEVQVRASDGTSSFLCFFDLRDKTVGTASGCVGQIEDLGDELLLLIYFTPIAATGVVELLLANGSEAVSYTGAVTNTIAARRAIAHPSAATLDLDGFTPEGGTCFAVAAHNLGAAGCRVTFSHDSNNDGTYTSIGSTTPTDDSAIMFFFNSITSAKWRVTIDRGALPSVGVVWIGDPLTFERPFYSGFTPARMNRATDVIGNISRTGELIGRSVKRTILQEQFPWQNLSYDWVRANLDGRNGVIQSLEDSAAFMAWRPSEATEDVSYLMRARADPPSPQGRRDLWSFSISAEVYAHE